MTRQRAIVVVILVIATIASFLHEIGAQDNSWISGVNPDKAIPAESLILMAALSNTTNMEYYEANKYTEKLINFQIGMARSVLAAGLDRILILVDDDAFEHYRKFLPSSVLYLLSNGSDCTPQQEKNKKCARVNPMWDVWIRDYGTVNPYRSTLLFQYTDESQAGDGEASAFIQNRFEHLLKHLKIDYHRVSNGQLNDPKKYYLDGGNFVDNQLGDVIVTTRFLADNKLNESDARKLLLAQPGIRRVAIIPDLTPRKFLGHADGLVMFVRSNLVLIDARLNDSFTAQVKTAIDKGFNNRVTIDSLDVPYVYTDRLISKLGNYSFDPMYPTACGLYVNSLVTPRAIYVPQYGLEDIDSMALKSIYEKSRTHSFFQDNLNDMLTLDNELPKIVPIKITDICELGGSVRCITAQYTGYNADKFP